MEASAVATFCAVKELTFVELTVRDGVKGGWFEDRKRNRSFHSVEEVKNQAEKARSSRITRVISYTS